MGKTSGKASRATLGEISDNMQRSAAQGDHESRVDFRLCPDVMMQLHGPSSLVETVHEGPEGLGNAPSGGLKLI